MIPCRWRKQCAPGKDGISDKFDSTQVTPTPRTIHSGTIKTDAELDAWGAKAKATIQSPI